ncbi:MAG TPA: hypothetical protein PLB67_09815 [Candidatus Hydrogenedentes bacterium]|jgi:hypothetical protein|nr:hypothetical protein [Candidatus Hydrogenedentota bacterium]MDY0032157.1 hypothetical protein [FCB group bacterium]NLT61910.1 hypothetical protein [Candidatus Hydrogenedentota bacterium]HNV20085.1 hypothetical protein [Candidatus Hydrogenedentota bacterium]HNZ17867.1 hypothetical protein [Candidatus Hydrogenedentota bacterium]
MSEVTCPHCGKTRIMTTRIPRDVVVMLPCPECHELVVLFRGKAIPLNREVLRNGTKEERRNHIAEIVEECLPPELFSEVVNWDFTDAGLPIAFGDRKVRRRRRGAAPEEDGRDRPITDEEVARFRKFELHRIDEPRYFKKYFG